MEDFEFFVPNEQKPYIEYILANSEIEEEEGNFYKSDYETIKIINYKDGEITYERDCLARERDNKVLPFNKGLKILFKYYKNHKSDL